MRFAATDDHAVIHLASGVVRLRLAAGAGDLFLFAYDRWVGNSITVTVTPMGRSTWRGTEVNEGAADIEVRNRGRRSIARRRLTCESGPQPIRIGKGRPFVTGDEEIQAQQRKSAAGPPICRCARVQERPSAVSSSRRRPPEGGRGYLSALCRCRTI